MPKTEQSLIVCSGKSEAKITNNKRLHSRHCTVEASEARSIVWFLCDSRTTSWFVDTHRQTCRCMYKTIPAFAVAPGNNGFQ